MVAAAAASAAAAAGGGPAEEEELRVGPAGPWLSLGVPLPTWSAQPAGGGADLSLRRGLYIRTPSVQLLR
jgi:hypothetical protein